MNITDIDLTNNYATHAPYLFKILDILKDNNNPILELGCGDSSTPILRHFCQKHNIKLITAENNLNWLNKVKNSFPENKNHEYVAVADWSQFISLSSQMKYSLIFVDQSPWEARKESIEKLRNCCDFMILHDCDYYIKYNVINSYSDFAINWKEFYPQNDGYPAGPPTLILSNKNIIPV